MAFVLQIECPGEPSPEALEAAIEAVTAANAAWFVEQYTLGLDPPCCCDCAGIVHVPARPSRRHRVRGAPQIIASKRASCDEMAALEAGHNRAVAILQGADPMQAAAVHYVELGPGDHPEADGDPYWHAYCRSPEGLSDPTEVHG